MPGMELLSDDLLEQVLGQLDSEELRAVGHTCRRFARLLRTRAGLWSSVSVTLPPRRSRGRDRRNSYTTPCALNVPCIRAWLAYRRGGIRRLTVICQYPDALLLLPELVPPLAPGLHHLAVHGSCTEWPIVSVDWSWLAGLHMLESLSLLDALPALPPLDGCLPPSLTQLLVDRVGCYEGSEEGADDQPLGWDELPPSLVSLPRLVNLQLGSCCAAWADDEAAALAPLTACTALRQLSLPHSTLTIMPMHLTKLSRGLTSLACPDSTFQAADEGLSLAFAALAALTQLRHLDLSYCHLRQLPAEVVGLPFLESLLLSGNCLSYLPAGAPLRQLTRLELAATALRDFFAASFDRCGQMRVLDLSDCRISATKDDWAGMLQGMPSLQLLRHSSVAAQRLAAPTGVALEYVAPKLQLRSAASAPALVGAELLEVLQAAATLFTPEHAPETADDSAAAMEAEL